MSLGFLMGWLWCEIIINLLYVGLVLLGQKAATRKHGNQAQAVADKLPPRSLLLLARLPSHGGINLPFSSLLIRARRSSAEWKGKADAEVNHRTEREGTVRKKSLLGLISIYQLFL